MASIFDDGGIELRSVPQRMVNMHEVAPKPEKTRAAPAMSEADLCEAMKAGVPSIFRPKKPRVNTGKLAEKVKVASARRDLVLAECSDWISSNDVWKKLLEKDPSLKASTVHNDFKSLLSRGVVAARGRGAGRVFIDASKLDEWMGRSK
jgi:hypothetical protein